MNYSEMNNDKKHYFLVYFSYVVRMVKTHGRFMIRALQSYRWSHLSDQFVHLSGYCCAYIPLRQKDVQTCQLHSLIRAI